MTINDHLMTTVLAETPWGASRSQYRENPWDIGFGGDDKPSNCE
jgi:hypothetical protein